MSAIVALHPLVAYAECYCNLTEPVDVIVKNWQTFQPKVTAMHSLNAYIANQLGQAVYYVPTLDKLPNVRNRMYNCTDFRGTNQKFAAIYDGYFDVECQDVLLKRPNGEYTKVPEMMKNVEPGSERELTILGYDFLLTKESIRDITTNGTAVSVTYQADKLDMRSGSVDVRTAVMNIYKAIGQEVQETVYVFTEDPTLTLETSPIQSEIHLQMAQGNSIDVSAGAGYVFTTRTNPDLYWEKAERDHIIMNVSAGEVSNTTATHTLTLAEFCSYAYEIMSMYGEPVMTTSEKSILLQLYGTSVPYKGVDGFAVEAIENFIAKGIISPDDDQADMNWNAPITPKYMLTLLMRIADVDSRMTYKDVEITINPTLLDQNWYAAGINIENSPILKLNEDPLYAKVATYTENRFAKNKVVSDLGAHDNDAFYIQNHLVVHNPNDGKYYPLGVLVNSTPGYADEEKKTFNDFVNLYQKDGDKVAVTTPFGECLGWEGGENGKLRINIYIKKVGDLLQSDGTYHIHMQKEDGSYSSGYLQIPPGKSADESTPRRGTSSSDDDEEDEDKYDDDWEEDEEEDASDWYDEPGVNLASTVSAVVMMEITPGTESEITFKSKVGGAKKTLAQIMDDVNPDNGYGYLIPGDDTEIHIKKVSDSLYQVEGVQTLAELRDRAGDSMSKAKPIEGFVNQDTELIVSTDWLKEAGFIVDFNTEQGNENVLVLKSTYNEIYLDRSKKIIVAGTTVYSLQNLKEDEIFMSPKSGTYYVNFRAVMGWTGDFMLFKDSGNGTVTVSVTGYPKSARCGNNLSGTSGNTIQIDMKRIEDSTSPISGLFDNTEMSQSIQGFSATDTGRYGKKTVSMTVTYPYANWMIYSRGALGESTDATDNDWLFVFKPKRVKINGKDVEYDDSASRQIFTTIMGPKDMSQDLISIWTYPLYRNQADADKNPEGFIWNEALGWIYQPQEVDDSYDFLVEYLDGTKTYNGGSDGRATSPIPLVTIKGQVTCMNLNSYSVNKNGQEELLEYGTIPVVALRPLVGSDGTVKSISGTLKSGAKLATSIIDKIHSPFTGGLIDRDQTVGSALYNTIEGAIDALGKEYYCGINNSGMFEIRRNVESGVSMENCKVYPTVVSPALWVMDLQQYDFEWIKQNYANCKILTGTDLIQIIKLRDGSIQVWQGNTRLDEEEFSKKKFLRIRNSNANGAREYIFSESQLTSFTLNSDSKESPDENRTMDTLGVGRASSHIDVIDWDEFTLRRLLEDFEFGVAITMVVVLYIIPRVCLFVFLMLLSLAVIQNVKLVQWFCDRVFDPYKFLTMGRRNVHTFRPGVAFRNSIIAMAVFALFMDGTIIHLFEWVVQFLAYIFIYH